MQAGNLSDVELGSRGEIYYAASFSDRNNDRYGSVRVIEPDGRIRRVAGSDTVPLTMFREGVGATELPFVAPKFGGGTRFGVTSTGRLWTVGYDRVIELVPGSPSLKAGERLVGAGDINHVFDAGGRHLRTEHALTSGKLLDFGYDGEGRLATITDGDGQRVTVARSGDEVRLTAPGGQQTVLSLDSDGRLSGVESPGARSWAMSYQNGRLRTFADPSGVTSTFSYDAVGRLTRDANSAGAAFDLDRTASYTEVSVTTTSAAGQTTIYKTQQVGGGVVERSVEEEGQAPVVTRMERTGRIETTAADGMKTITDRAPDRSGDGTALRATRVETVSPAGKRRIVDFEREVVFAPTGGIESLTDREIEGDAEQTSVYDGAARTLTRTSAEGRTAVTTLDNLGRMTRHVPAVGQTPVTRTYDSRGRVRTEGRGASTVTHTYDAANRLVSTRFPGGAVQAYGYNDADELVSTTRPGGGVLATGRNASGDVTTRTTPLGDAWSLEWSHRAERLFVDGPGTGRYSWTRDADERTTARGYPSGATSSVTRDSGERVTGETLPSGDGSLGFTYTPAGLVATATRQPATGAPTVTSYSRDGALPTATELTGPGAQRVEPRFDAEMRVDQLSASAGGAGYTHAIERDDDQLITRVGPTTVERDPQTGDATAYVDGNRRVEVTYDGLGRRTGETHRIDDTVVFRAAYEFDAAGRVSAREQSVAGDPLDRRTYAYDPKGRLTGVDGPQDEAYTWDDQDNRLTRRLGADPVSTATYTAGDRIDQEGATDYTLDPDGIVTGRGSDTFSVSRRGELLSATVGGETISYAYNESGHRVSRTDPQGTVTYVYGDPGNDNRVTAVREGDALTVLGYDDQGRLLSLERGGTRYGVGTDSVGTPKVVYEPDGDVVKRIEHDAFGREISDSNPAFALPIGFAGGISDPETGLVRMGVRDYDPATARFFSPDPSLFDGSPLNLHGYADGDPVGKYDPTGLVVTCASAAAYVGIGFGLEHCTDTKTGEQSLCVEVGAGLGGGFKIDPFGQIAQPGGTYVAELGGEAGSLGGSVQFEVNPCTGDRSVSAEVGAGTVSASGKVSCGPGRATNANCTTSGNVTTGVPLGAKAVGKVAAKSCIKT